MGPFDASWLSSTVILTAPLLFAAMGELIAERSGIINVGLEGMMLLGAFCAFLVCSWTGSVWLGVIAGLVGGASLAAVMALAAIEGRANQVVVGIGLYIAAGGITTFADAQLFPGGAQTSVQTMSSLPIPLLDRIPYIGAAFFNQVPLVYLAFLLVPVTYLALWHTAWGLSVRAAGEAPEAVDASGRSVRAARWSGTLLAGAGAGLGGALLTVGSIGVFTDNITSGRGYIALAAVVLGRWSALGALGACLLFGGADALQLRLQAIGGIPWQVWVVVALVPIIILARHSRRRRVEGMRGPLILACAALVLAAIHPDWNVPADIWQMLPYALTVLVLAGFIGRSGVPSALGLPYTRRVQE